MNIREIKEKYSVNNRQLSVVTGIPMRSLQQWEKGERKPPEYIYGLIESALERNVVVRRDAPVLVGHTPTVSASRVNSILMKDFCALTREDVEELNRAYHAQMLEEAARNDTGGIYKCTQVKLAYNSNKMEGNRMTVDDATLLFETGIVPDGECRPKDIEEMRGHFVMFNNAMGGFYSPLDEDTIKSYHYDLQCGGFEFIANGYRPGEYKSKENTVAGITTSSPANVARDMAELLADYCSSSGSPVENIALFHCRYETIHPFQDGNGRTGRMVLFKEAFAQVAAPVIISDEKKKEYRAALRSYQETASESALAGFLESCQEEFYEVLRKYMYDHSVPLSYVCEGEEEMGNER